MSLRSDSVYRVDLREPSHRQPGSEDDDEAGAPPKVLQLRLTEQALQQLANAYTSSHGHGDDPGQRARIRIDVNSADPLLVIGDTSFPLHAPLPAGGAQSRSAATASDATSTSTAPHELYRLSKDESTLHRIGTIATKLSVKPTRDVSAVAQRLKQQKEEEEHRKEERRKALLQGASPQLSTSSSSRSGINKTLASVRATSGSPSLASSPLSRSSSLNKLSSRREPNLLHSATLSRGVSREPSPGARPSSPAVVQTKLQGASYDAGPSARRADRAITDSPKTAASVQSRGSTRLHDTDHASDASRPTSSRIASSSSNAAADDDGLLSEDDQPSRTSHLSSPASGASELASGAKKTNKLTTRQRLAKATKAGSRLLAVSERRATPERRPAPTATHTSPPSKLSSSSTSSMAESSRAALNGSSQDVDASLSKGAPKAASRDSAATAPLRKAGAERADDSVESRARTTTGVDRSERGGKVSPSPGSSARSVRDEPSTLPKKPVDSSRPQRIVDSKKQVPASKPGSRSSASVLDKESVAAKPRTEATANAQREPNKPTSKVEPIGGRPRSSSRIEAVAPVQVVTMRKARPSETNLGAMAKTQPAEPSPSTRLPRRSDAEASERDRTARADKTKRRDPSADHDMRASSTSPAKQAATRKSGDDDTADGVQRKRRRTNDFAASDLSSQHRERKRSQSPGSDIPRVDEGPSRRREPSRDGSIRRVEPASPRESQLRGGVSTSASMPSFASSAHRLQPVPEASDREARRPRAGEYHDRRRDRSYDDTHYDDFATHDRVDDFHARDGRRGRQTGDDAPISSRGPNSSSVATKTLSPSSSSSAERPIRGVGPGATHWSEPWLDVRSKADWHRLAQRFAKAQEEYTTSRKRLEAESERLDRELELASMEEQETPRPIAPRDAEDTAAEQSLLFSPHNHSPSGGDQPDVVMRDREVETAINTSINSRTRRSARAKPAEDGDESPEEGEMRSSDDEEGRAGSDDAQRSKMGTADQRSPGTTSSSMDSVMLASRRSESPDNFTWRPNSAKMPAQLAADASRPGLSAAVTARDGADRPLSYTDLANRVQQLSELHGSLSRMHRVLVDFKAKGLATSIK